MAVTSVMSSPADRPTRLRLDEKFARQLPIGRASRRSRANVNDVDRTLAGSGRPIFGVYQQYFRERSVVILTTAAGGGSLSL
ncbi:hypothetical protein ACER0C_015589 [Sarotherodon galilaeus]